ncbi:MAG: SCO family protein [Proteobacteria bacterium]|nr:SCO family protein [Pseudomonadota bacterium]
MRRSHVRGAVRHATLYILAAALAAGFGLWAAENRVTSRATPPPPLRAVDLFPAARALPAFQLQGAGGTKITPAALKGHWTLVYLGYTHCPDVCPTTLQALGVASKSWAALPAAQRPRIWFVSVDPGRDTPDHTAQYAGYFGKDITGATADDKTLAAFARALGMVYFVDKGGNGKPYSVDHSDTVSVLDKEGEMVGVIQPAQPPAQPFDPAAIGTDMQALTKWR